MRRTGRWTARAHGRSSLGLPAVAFTEHVDHTVWSLDRSHVDEDAHLLTFTSSDGLVTPGPFDAAGYLEAVAQCRERYPGLRILSGLEPRRAAPALRGRRPCPRGRHLRPDPRLPALPSRRRGLDRAR